MIYKNRKEKLKNKIHVYYMNVFWANKELIFLPDIIFENSERQNLFISNHIKGELGELHIYFRKIPLHQRKFLVVSVLSNLPWLPRNLKNIQNETT